MKLERKNTVFDILFALLMFSIPLSIALPNLLLVVLIPLFIIKKKKIEAINIYTKIVVVFILYFIIKAIFAHSFIQNISSYKHLLAFGLLSILTLGIENRFLVKKAYIIGVFLAVIFSLIQSGVYYFNHHSLPFGNSDQIKHVLFIHRPYYGFMCLLAIILIDEVYFNLTSKTQKKIGIIICVVLVVFVYLIVARLALLLIFSYLIFKIFKKTKSSKKKVLISFSVILTTFSLLLLINKNFKNRLHIKDSFSETLKVVKNQEPRFVIWSCFFNGINKPEFNLVFGYMNAKKIKETLNDCYNNTIENESKKAYYLETKFNTHNQFFDFFLQGGFISILLFLAMFFFSFFLSKNSFNAFFIIISLFLFLLIENLFHRQIGVYLMGVFIPLFQKKRFK